MLAPTQARAWHGLRLLVEALPSLCSEREIASLYAKHRPALSRVPGLQGLGLKGPAHDEDVARPLMAARTLSHLSHNFLLQKPLFEALADFVHAATAATGLTLMVPDLAILDRESVGLIRTLFRRHPRTHPPLVAGFDPDRLTPEPDADGLIWELRREEVWRVVMGFLSLPGAEARNLPRPPNAPSAPGGPHGRLGTPPADGTEALRDVRVAFESFAFEFTVRAGLALIRRGVDLTPRQRAEAEGLVALAAHNRQFRSLGNRRLAEFLCERLAAAFETENRPAERSALCYRLAVAYGRRLKDREAGLAWSERAIDEASRADLPAADAAILEAWGRNIKAFMLTGTGRLLDAAGECERAYRQLDAALAGESTPLRSPRASVREAAFSRSILADNLGAIHQMVGDIERTQHWKKISDGHNREVPEVERYEARFWIATYRRQLRLDAAAGRAQRGLRAARREQDALREYRYGVELADLRYRLRDAAGALAAFKDAEALYVRLGAPPFLRPTRLAPAVAASRASRSEEALARIDAALSSLSEEPSDVRIQILAQRGLCLARAGRAEDTEVAIDAAIALAVSSGERDLLLTVAVTAGRACQLLNRMEEAEEAYLQAVDIASEEVDGADNPPAALELAAYLGRLETFSNPADDTSAAHRCLRLFTAALDDAETWWRLPRLAIQLERVLKDDPSAVPVLERIGGIIAQSEPV